MKPSVLKASCKPSRMNNTLWGIKFQSINLFALISFEQFLNSYCVHKESIWFPSAPLSLEGLLERPIHHALCPPSLTLLVGNLAYEPLVPPGLLSFRSVLELELPTLGLRPGLNPFLSRGGVECNYISLRRFQAAYEAHKQLWKIALIIFFSSSESGGWDLRSGYAIEWKWDSICQPLGFLGARQVAPCSEGSHPQGPFQVPLSYLINLSSSGTFFSRHFFFWNSLSFVFFFIHWCMCTC